MHTLFGKSINNNRYCYRHVSKGISNDSEKYDCHPDNESET